MYEINSQPKSRQEWQDWETGIRLFKVRDVCFVY